MQTSAPERITAFRQLGWWGDTTTWQLFRACVEAKPDAVALIDPVNRASFTQGPPARYSWQELLRHVELLAGHFARVGIASGDIVVLQLPNTVESIISYLGLTRIGAIVSPVPMQYGVHELRGIAASVRPRAFLSTTFFKEQNIVQTNRAAFGDAVLILAVEDFAARSDPAAPEPAAVSADAVFSICWTSGTTGTPKGVPRSHNQWLAQSLAMEDIGITPNMVMLCPFPLVNMASLAGFFFPWLRCRGTLVLHQPMDLSVFLGQIEAERVAYTIAPPALLNLLLKQRELMQRFDISSLRLMASGSAPLSPWMVRGFQEDFGIEVVNVFGSNEGMSLLSSAVDVPDPEKRATLFPRFGVAGIPWANRIASRMRTRLVDTQTGAVIDQPGPAGEMQIWGPNVIDGYHDAAETNREVFSEDGYFRTGDLFEIAAEDRRFYRFVGRCKDIVIRGGMKISPDELDALLAAHPLLTEAAVVGYADPILGERICAVVVPKPGATVTLADLVAFLEERQIARFKLPEKLVVTLQLPRNPLGKVVRPALKQLVEPA